MILAISSIDPTCLAASMMFGVTTCSSVRKSGVTTISLLAPSMAATRLSRSYQSANTSSASGNRVRNRSSLRSRLVATRSVDGDN